MKLLSDLIEHLYWIIQFHRIVYRWILYHITRHTSIAYKILRSMDSSHSRVPKTCSTGALRTYAKIRFEPHITLMLIGKFCCHVHMSIACQISVRRCVSMLIREICLISWKPERYTESPVETTGVPSNKKQQLLTCCAIYYDEYDCVNRRARVIV